MNVVYVVPVMLTTTTEVACSLCRDSIVCPMLVSWRSRTHVAYEAPTARGDVLGNVALD